MPLICLGDLNFLITKKNKIVNNVFVFSTVTQTLGVKIPERYYRLGVRLRWRTHEIDIQFWWGTILESIHVERRRNRIIVGTVLHRELVSISCGQKGLRILSISRLSCELCSNFEF